MNGPDRTEQIAACSKVIFNWCRARVTNLADAEDLSQDILTALLASADSLRSKEAFYGFMWGTAGNVFRGWLRKKKRRAESELPLDESAPLTDGEDFAERLANAGEDERNVLLLRRELGLLEAKYRRAVLLCYRENLSCAEIASLTGTSESMVKYLLFKSRSKLKEGIVMERKLGALSYSPVSLVPHYSGNGTNYFHGFMQSKIRQNILYACTNDALTPEEISLEIGVPLPYMEDDLSAMEEKRILLKRGKRYLSNVIVETAAYFEETERAAEKFHGEIARKTARFLDERLCDFRALGENTAAFSDNTLRWQLAAVVFRTIRNLPLQTGISELPETAWGDRAFLWCAEITPALDPDKHNIFRYSAVGTERDALLFWDYVPRPCGDHHDFFGKEHKISLYCALARGERDPAAFGDYELHALAALEEKGYVVRRPDPNTGLDTLRCAAAVFTADRYRSAQEMAADFADSALAGLIGEMRENACRILKEHTPKHLADQVPGIASTDVFLNGICIPAEHMIADGVLTTDWIPGELPGVTVVLGANEEN